jgi:two-component system, cell cycle sensor histidine kinase and response regulator CckA
MNDTITCKKQTSILVVEDEQMLLDLLKDVLEQEGFDVLTALDGMEAMALYKSRKNDIALVISDIGLPKLNGDEALVQIKRIRPDVKVVLSTGYLDPSKRDDLLKAGAADFIQKPFILKEVINKVHFLLGQ